MTVSDLEFMIGPNEKILWRGRPDKKCFILKGLTRGIFSVIPIFELQVIFMTVVMVRRGFFSMVMEEADMVDKISAIVLVSMFHIVPVCSYIVGVILLFRRYRKTEYIVTDGGVYISGGALSNACVMKPFAELSHVYMYRGTLERWLDVGDVVMLTNQDSSQSEHSDAARGISISISFGNQDSSQSGHSHAARGISISYIPDYLQVFDLVKQLQTDIHSDIMYPNDLRPQANRGYQTQPKG